MRKAVKVQILQILSTIQEAHGEIVTALRQGQTAQVRTMLADCQECAVLVGETIEQFEQGCESIIGQLEAYCEQLFHMNNGLLTMSAEGGAGFVEDLNVRIRQVYEDIRNNIKVQLKVVFMPYKYSMWTSLESVWKAAAADEECEAKVVVIPYYTLDGNGNPVQLEYEGDQFPEETQVVHYSEYNVAAEQPDMIFIHNPYDDTNNVTRVPAQYYSYNLKKYTEQLIYSPYGMMGYYNPEQGAFMCNTNAVLVADKVLVQSERVKQIYEAHGIRSEKLLALGSPKVDAIVNNAKKPKVYPPGWEEKLKGKKVFLINIHLSYFIYGHMYAMNNPGRQDYAKAMLDTCFKMLLNQEDRAIILRPHPLLKDMLRSRGFTESLQYIEDAECKILESSNAVIDTYGDYSISFNVSDALITGYSSLISEYMITGKPIYIYQHRLNEEYRHQSPVDYSNNYYRARPGESARFPLFYNMVLRGEDDLYEARMADVHKAFSNLDGTIGEQVYARLKSEWQI